MTKHLTAAILIFFFSCASLHGNTKIIPEPYCSITELPFDNQGWFSNQKQIEACIKKIKPKTVIEVGSWLGLSTRFIAERLPQKSKLYAVDTWRGSPGEELHMQDPRLPHLFQLFLSNVRHARLTDVIVPIRMDSLEASEALNVHADMIYIDASHETESVYNDILAWYPHLKKGGILCGDDWSWSTVRAGVTKAAAVLNCSVIGDNNFWQFEFR